MVTDKIRVQVVNECIRGFPAFALTLTKRKYKDGNDHTRYS